MCVNTSKSFGHFGEKKKRMTLNTLATLSHHDGLYYRRLLLQINTYCGSSSKHWNVHQGWLLRFLSFFYFFFTVSFTLTPFKVRLRQWWPSVSAVAMTTSSPTEWCHANLVPARRAVVSLNTLRHSGGRLRHVRAAEAAVWVQAVVEGLAVDTQDVGLQVALLGRVVGAVPALERLPGCRKDERTKQSSFLDGYI